MKKILSTLMVFLLLLSTSTGASAFTISPETKSPLIGQTLLSGAYIQENINTEMLFGMGNTILVGDTAYTCFSDGALYSFKAGADSAERYCTVPARPIALNNTAYNNLQPGEKAEVDEILNLLVADGDTLCAFNTYTGRIGRIDESGITWQEERFDPELFAVEDWPRILFGAHIIDGKLYVMADFYEEDYSAMYCHGILVVDIATGETRRLDVANPLQLSAYGEGELLVLRAPEEGPLVFSAYNIETATLRDLPLAMPDTTYGIGGLAYDAATDTIMYSEVGGIYRSINGAAFERVCPYPFSYASADMDGWIMANGQYALGMDGISILNTNDVDPENILTLSVRYKDSDLMNAFAQQHPSVIADARVEELTAADIAARIAGGDTETDVFELSIDNTFGALKRKGFAADLSVSPELKADAENLYPAIRAALKNEAGQLVAYPLHMHLSQWSVNTALWPLYFGDEAVPTTYSALLDAMLRFEETDGPDGGSLFLCEWSYENMIYKIITSYIEQADTRAQPLTFDAPELLLALDKLAQVNEMMLSKGITYLNEGDEYPYDDVLSHSVFYTSGGATNVLVFTAKDLEDDRYLMPFTFTADQTPIIHSYMTVLIMNPNSQKQDLALDYIACAATQASDVRRYYMIHESATEPVEKPDYQQKIDGYIQTKADLEVQIAALVKSDPKSSEIISLQNEYDRMERYLDDTDFVRYEITPEGIAKWQQIMPHIQFYEDSLYLAGEGSAVQQQLESLCNQYASGRFSTPDFLKQLTSTLEMIYKEGTQ